jgi:hypothetical protein
MSNDDELKTEYKNSESCPQTRKDLQNAKQYVQGWTQGDNQPSWYGKCKQGYTPDKKHETWRSGWGGLGTKHHKWKTTCVANNDTSDAIDSEYSPKTEDEQVKCCGRSIDEAGKKESQKACNPFCPYGNKCHLLMKKYCVSGDNTFDELGDSSNGTGNFFSKECQSWINLEKNTDYKEDAMRLLCKKGENWKTSACQTWCTTHSEECQDHILKECAKPENWDDQKCINWCNEDCDGGACPNLKRCHEAYVEKPENCGTAKEPGDKIEDKNCACYTPLSERKPVFKNTGVILRDKTSCIDETCKGYMAIKCTGDIINCVQNLGTKGGVAENLKQTMNCLGGDPSAEVPEVDDDDSSDDDEEDDSSDEDESSDEDDESEEGKKKEETADAVQKADTASQLTSSDDFTQFLEKNKILLIAGFAMLLLLILIIKK